MKVDLLPNSRANVSEQHRRYRTARTELGWDKHEEMFVAGARWYHVPITDAQALDDCKKVQKQIGRGEFKPPAYLMVFVDMVLNRKFVAGQALPPAREPELA